MPAQVHHVRVVGRDHRAAPVRRDGHREEARDRPARLDAPRAAHERELRNLAPADQDEPVARGERERAEPPVGQVGAQRLAPRGGIPDAQRADCLTDGALKIVGWMDSGEYISSISACSPFA